MRGVKEGEGLFLTNVKNQDNTKNFSDKYMKLKKILPVGKAKCPLDTLIFQE